MASATRRPTTTKKSAATNARNFRRLLLVQQFAAGEIGERIAQARREADGMTQEQLAELLNVSTRSVQDYEAGVTIPWKYFRLLEGVFKRPMEWFLYGDQEEPAVVDLAVLAQLDRIERTLEALVARSDSGGQADRAAEE